MRLSILDISPVPPDGTAREAFTHSVELAQLAERCGYHRYWVAEHHGIGYRNAGSTPEVLIAYLATLTSRIRVGSGAVLLDKYSAYKVADTFRVLHTLFGDRIDLGVGRGSSPPAVEAAMRTGDEQPAEPMLAAVASTLALFSYREQVAELLAWLEYDFPPDHPYGAYPLSPGVVGGPQPWLLGSTATSAALAGQLGMRYCFAAFLNPLAAPTVLDIYRSAFQARTSPEGHDRLAAPYTMLAVSAVCAATDEEADLLRGAAELHARRVSQGDPAADLPLPIPIQALAELGRAPAPIELTPDSWPRHLSGSPERMAEMLGQISKTAGADELMVCDLVGDHRARLRSYELLGGVAREAS